MNAHGLSRCDNLSQYCGQPTYVNPALNHQSCIDFILLASNITETSCFEILDPDINFSDHLPIYVTVTCDIPPNGKSKETTNNVLLPCQYFLRWDKADTNSYYYYTGHHLQHILQALDNSIKNCETLLPSIIDNIYNDNISVLATGANIFFVPARQTNFYKFWWDKELSAVKEAAVESNRLWKASRKPRHFQQTSNM